MANGQNNYPTVSVINQSSAVKDDDLQDCMTALQTQISQHFQPVWNLGANLKFVGSDNGDPNTWWLVVFDDSDRANAAGYHDLNPNGLPIAKVFAQTDMDYGKDWCVTASHELMEMLVDPHLNQSVQLSDPKLGNIQVAKEICDPCEGSTYGISNVNVSNFVTPAWFNPFGSTGSQFDYLSQISQPFRLLSGGYITYQQAGQTNWSQFNAELLTNGKPSVWSNGLRPRVGSRRERRNLPLEHWMLSNPNGKKFKKKKSLDHFILTAEFPKKSRKRSS